MRYRFKAKMINQCLTCILLVLVVVAALVVVQLVLYYDSLSMSCVQSNVNTANPYLDNYSGSIKPRDSSVSRGGLRSRTLSRFSDLKYNQLKVYHQRGITLRKQFDCRKLFEGDPSEQGKVTQFHSQNSNTYTTISNEIIPEIITDCEAFRAIRGYRVDQGSTIEREFPLAYVILVHRDFEHLERLLRTLYMPQHYFCIHVDKKAPENLQEAVRGLARCFDNVIMASRPQEIIYAHMSRLMADVLCMRDLMTKYTNWRYLINYAATELPLRTNQETVHILQLLHGLNDIHEQFERRLQDRFKKEYEIVDGKMKQTQKALPPPPYNMTIIKGQAYNTYSRDFIKWMLTDEKPRKLLDWSSKTFSPDEHYWATLNDLYHNPFLETPGGFKGHPDKKGYISRFISWQYTKPKFKCHGRSVHNICNFSALDLPTLLNEMHLAANKFDLTLDPVAYACMEEWLHNKTLTQLPFNLYTYSRLYFINYQSPVS